MNKSDSADSRPQDEPARKRALSREQITRFLAILMLPLFLFPIAGCWDWWQGWAYIAGCVLPAIISRALVARKNPDLIQERAQYNSGEGVKSWDKKLVPLIVYLPLLAMVIAALNLRFAWLPQIPLWQQMLGLAGMALGMVFSSWAMVANRFFAALVRIQTDRGHTVVSTGPYRIMRHPGYAGGMLADLSFPFLLGSAWALIPIAIVLALIIIRTSLEDQTLKEELPGYQEYAAHVRYRLLPGVW
jgi:protein-S-isoprenylcysteine O-methyltransferase Ste14